MPTPSKLRKILLVNDDGPTDHFRGLYRALVLAGHDVKGMCPADNRSGAGTAVFLDGPLQATQHEDGFMMCNGFPNDCTNLGLHMWPDRDMVVSGVNRGYNALAFLSSGTIAAARQAIPYGLPGIAISANGGRDLDPLVISEALMCVEHAIDYGSDPVLHNFNVVKNATGINTMEATPMRPALRAEGTEAEYEWPDLYSFDNEVSVSRRLGLHSHTIA